MSKSVIKEVEIPGLKLSLLYDDEMERYECVVQQYDREKMLSYGGYGYQKGEAILNAMKEILNYYENLLSNLLTEQQESKKDES